MKFIELTFDGSPILINLSHVTEFIPTSKGTNVCQSVGEDDMLLRIPVSESYNEIREKLDGIIL